MMDGSYTVARLVAEFARIAGRLAPDQVRRVVADLAGNRMLEELPVDAFRPLQEIVPKPLPARIGSSLLAAARGRRMLVADIDRRDHRALPGRRPVPVHQGRGDRARRGQRRRPRACSSATWWQGSEAVFLTNGSYLLGAVVLLLLNVLALACHELGHALATKHAGREVPAAGFLVYFGIPSVFVDTTDVWMAGRRARILVTAAGPATGLVLAGSMQLVGLAVPALGPLAFKLAFAWYLNVLFNLNPFLTLDGYYLLMDWLEIPNLRARGLSWVSSRLRGRPPRWSGLDREGRIVALYGVLAVLWLAIAANLAYRIWADRVSGLATGLWHSGVLGSAAARARWSCWACARRWSTWRRPAGPPGGAGPGARRRTRARGRPARAASRRCAPPTWAACPSRRWPVWPPGPAGCTRRPVSRWSPPAARRTRSTWWSTARCRPAEPGDPGGTIRHHVGPGGVVGLAERADRPVHHARLAHRRHHAAVRADRDRRRP